MAVPSLHFDNRIYVAMGTSFCVPSGKWSGAKTGSQGGDESGCPSDPRNPLTRLWQAGRDDGADHNGSKDELHIEFNYQDEYKKAVALAEQIVEQAAERKVG